MIIHTADLHIGAFGNRQLRYASIDALEEIARYAVGNGIKHIIVAGDFFEKEYIRSYDILRRVFRILRSLKDNGVNVISIPGSHDGNIGEANTLVLLNEAGLVHIPYYEEQKDYLILYPLEIDDTVIYGLPGMRNNLELTYLSRNRVLFKNIDEYRGKKIILAAHTSVRFAGIEPGIYSYRYAKSLLADEKILSSIPDMISYIALGHIHFPIPLEDEMEINIAYPGAPIGRDANDLYETFILRKERGKNRRFLVIDLDREKPLARSIWMSFNVVVEYYRDYYKGHESLMREVKRIIRDMDEGYHVLILDINGLKPEDTDKIIQSLREYERKYNVFIHLRRSHQLQPSIDLSIDLGEATNISELERKAVQEAIKNLNLKASPEKILELIDLLGEEREGVSADIFYQDLFNKIKPLLEEILGVSKQG